VIHHFQNKKHASPVVDAANEPVTIVADVEYDAVPDLISRTERLPECAEVLPVSAFGCRIPCGQVRNEQRPLQPEPAQPGRKVPQFAAQFADGTPFTTADLEHGTSTVQVFFRGNL